MSPFASFEDIVASEVNAVLPEQLEIKVEDLRNFRDAGASCEFIARRLSYSTVDVRNSLKQGKVFRSAQLTNLTDSGRKKLVDIGIKKVLDLRATSEIEELGKDELPKGIEYVHINLNAVVEDEVKYERELVEEEDYLNFGFHSMNMIYRRFVHDKKMRESFGIALEEIASTDSVLIHCRSGKDRTGWLVFLLGFILGTDEEVLIEEYLLSKAVSLDAAKRSAAYYEGKYSTNDWRFYLPFSSVYREYLQAAIDEAVLEFGSLNGYLKECGVTSETIEKLRKNYSKEDALSKIQNLTVLAGPTAVGKGTISRALIERNQNVYLSVSATTRSPREGEIDKIHYHFLSNSEFTKRIESGDFLEWAIVHGQNKYGTLIEPILEANAQGKAALLEIDLQGARIVKRLIPNAKFIFLAPPSFEELITRLGMRGTESLEERERRLETARVEMKAQNEFDYVVINDDREEAVRQVEEIVLASNHFELANLTSAAKPPSQNGASPRDAQTTTPREAAREPTKSVTQQTPAPRADAPRQQALATLDSDAPSTLRPQAPNQLRGDQPSAPPTNQLRGDQPSNAKTSGSEK